jgi:acid-sensing ion channel, other
MDDFACESTIAGARVFHTSESKQSRITWLFVYLLYFILIGFYVFNIFTRYQVEPEFSYEFSQIPIQELPFPAVTICHPLFSRYLVINLKNVLKNPSIVKNYTTWEHTLFASNVQACIPELGPKIDKLCPFAEPQKTVKALKRTFKSIDEAVNMQGNWRDCLFNWHYTSCSKIMNYVLTDFGFCFSFNLDAFPRLFNTKIISHEFDCYKRDQLSRNYDKLYTTHRIKINDDNLTAQWTLSKGYTTDSKHALPARILYYRNFGFHGRINYSDFENLCPKLGKSFLLFFHMPNEILTPFHQPFPLTRSYDFSLKAKLHETNENLRPFPPQKRNCYFEDERKLKFFKTYTKAHCEFECLANFTLVQCGCVKFSMPRDNSTRICGLNETSCYIGVAKNWNLTCECLKSCTYIEYEVGRKIPNVGWPRYE